MRSPRRRRFNSDDRLRRLERAAASGRYEDVSAYWLALLRVGQLPAPTFGDIQDIRGWAGWTIEAYDNWMGRIWQVNLTANTYVDELRDEVIYRPGANVEIWEQPIHEISGGEIEQVTFVDRGNAIQGVKRELKRLLEKYDDVALREKALRIREKWYKEMYEETP